MEESNPTPSPESCCDWQKSVGDFRGQTQQFIRDDPTKAIGLALLAGVVLTILPVGRVVGGLVRLAFALARPLMLVLGAVRLYEEFQKTQNR